jgi:hypothetical protein
MQQHSCLENLLKGLEDRLKEPRGHCRFPRVPILIDTFFYKLKKLTSGFILFPYQKVNFIIGLILVHFEFSLKKKKLSWECGFIHRARFLLK